MSAVGLMLATQIIDTALAHARERQLDPLVVAVLDAGGHLIAFKREDRAGIVRFDIAYGKAWGALGIGYGTRELAQRADSRASSSFVDVQQSTVVVKAGPLRRPPLYKCDSGPKTRHKKRRSKAPVLRVVGAQGFEPWTYGLRVRCSTS